MTKGLSIKPSKWNQFGSKELGNMVKRHYPDFGWCQIRQFDRATLTELLDLVDKHKTHKTKKN